MKPEDTAMASPNHGESKDDGGPATWPESKLPAIEGKHGPSLFPADARIAVGFGGADLTRDGEPVWSQNGREWDDCLTGAQAEAMAAADPDHDWRIELDEPLSSRTYQRHGPNEWALVAQGQGFA